MCPKANPALTLVLMQEIDRAFTEWPFLGVRQMRDYLVLLGYSVGRKRVRRLMRLDGADGGVPEAQNQYSSSRAYALPVSLAGIVHTRPNQVWCADITYIPMRKGFLYLVAVMDWHSKKVLSWRLSNTMDADFCVAALEEALANHGKPDIFNTDQGSQFTSFAFTNVLRENGIRISMDGRGRWLDNVFIELLWRSLKYECVYLHAFETGSEARAGIGRWIDFYNRLRPHSSLGGLPPDTYYEQGLVKAA